MYLNNFVGFRCERELYFKFKRTIKGREEIENTSHAIRIAMIKYIKELEGLPRRKNEEEPFDYGIY